MTEACLSACLSALCLRTLAALSLTIIRLFSWSSRSLRLKPKFSLTLADVGLQREGIPRHPVQCIYFLQSVNPVFKKALAFLCLFLKIKSRGIDKEK